MSADDDLFGERPRAPPKHKKRVRPVEITGHLWTEQKSTLIAEYLHLFLVVTRSGVYLDLFAGPQSGQYNADWSIKRVTELRDEGPNFTHLAACDCDPAQIAHLERLRSENASRPFNFKIYVGDVNDNIHQILDEAPLAEKRMPCFCLIDQRTLECHWDTVRLVADYKKQGYKIEIFYFLAENWLDRTWRSITHVEKLERWWGGTDYKPFLELRSVNRALALADRFRNELGYKHAEPWSIHEHGDSGKTMFYMVHASDHPRARYLMSQAYQSAPGAGLPRATQSPLFPGLLPGDGREQPDEDSH